jgi:hypothetical protein
MAGNVRIWHSGRRERRERISFREWKRRGGGKPGQRYEVRVIYSPQRYPNYSILWTDPDLNVDVRASINPQKFRELMRGWKPTQIIYYVVLEDGSDGFIFEDAKDGRVYQRESYGFVLRDTLPNDDEWESLGF